jgi:hypothetical protein
LVEQPLTLLGIDYERPAENGNMYKYEDFMFFALISATQFYLTI